MHIRLLCLLLCLSLVLHISLVAGQDLQPLPATSEVNGSTLVKASGSVRAGIPLSLYCNITGSCKPCKPEHLQAEACRQSGHAEKLTCMANNQVPYQVVIRLHRRVNTPSQIVHISRSCPAPAGAAAAAAATPPAAAATSDAGITQHESDTTVTDADKPHPRQVYFSGSRLAGVGGLNVLYFELAMLLVLSGALPAVVIRKRRYVRL